MVPRLRLDIDVRRYPRTRQVGPRRSPHRRCSLRRPDVVPVALRCRHPVARQVRSAARTTDRPVPIRRAPGAGCPAPRRRRTRASAPTIAARAMKRRVGLGRIVGGGQRGFGVRRWPQFGPAGAQPWPRTTTSVRLQPFQEQFRRLRRLRRRRAPRARPARPADPHRRAWPSAWAPRASPLRAPQTLRRPPPARASRDPIRDRRARTGTVRGRPAKAPGWMRPATAATDVPATRRTPRPTHLPAWFARASTATRLKLSDRVP